MVHQRGVGEEASGSYSNLSPASFRSTVEGEADGVESNAIRTGKRKRGGGASGFDQGCGAPDRCIGIRAQGLGLRPTLLEVPSVLCRRLGCLPYVQEQRAGFADRSEIASESGPACNRNRSG